MRKKIEERWKERGEEFKVEGENGMVAHTLSAKERAREEEENLDGKGTR